MKKATRFEKQGSQSQGHSTIHPSALWDFVEAIQSALGPIDLVPVADGEIHRFHIQGDRRGTRNGWYVLFDDGLLAGCYGSWKSSVTYKWSSRKPADSLEHELLRQRFALARQKSHEEQRQRQHEAKERAQRLWRDAHRADPSHPYLMTKACTPHQLRQLGDVLLVPLYHAGELVNLQKIWADGSKRFMKGGRVKGCYSPFGIITAGKPLYICEGWATGATLHAKTGNPVACAMNAGNLVEVGLHLRERHPEALLIIAGDDDRASKTNTGKTAAIGAAAALGCGYVLPAWPDEAPLSLTDFNDLWLWQEGLL